MTIFEQLDKNQLKELLLKCWMTHDGAWFYNCYNELGIEIANRLNKAAIRNLSVIEIQRVKNVMGMKSESIHTFEQFKRFIHNVFSILKGEFMNFIYSFPKENCMHWEMNQCFAYKGMKRFGINDLYECGIVYRVSCWLDALDIKHEISPKFKKCLLNSQERCSGNILIKSI